MIGKIKTPANFARGFGFITGEDGKAYFFHRSSLRIGDSFRPGIEGRYVEFDPVQDSRGPRAERVRLVRDN